MVVWTMLALGLLHTNLTVSGSTASTVSMFSV